MNRFYWSMLFLCLLPFIHIEDADGGAWVEDFNDPSFKSWIKHDRANRSTWMPKEGHLDVWIQPPPPPGIYDEYALEFVGFQFDTETLDVQLKIIEAHNASVGILIGQYDGNGYIYHRTVAFLHTATIGGVIFKPKEFDIIKKEEADDPIPAPLKAIEISFNKGDFEVFTKRKYIGTYRVPQLKTVNFVGLISIVGLGRGVIAHFVLDDFIVSGPTIPAHGTLNVRAKDKAAVVWGELKQR